MSQDAAAAPTPPAEITALLDEWVELRAVLAGLPGADLDRPTGCPGWSVRDVVAHVIGTEQLLAGEPLPDVSLDDHDTSHLDDPPGTVAGDIARMNELHVVAMRTLTTDELLAEFDRITGLRREQLLAMTPDQLAAETPSPIGVVPYVRFMTVRVFDCWVHEQDVRLAVSGDDPAAMRLTGPGVAESMATVWGSVPRSVGKGAGAPEGARVRIVATGGGEEPRDVVVEGGRARIGAAEPDARPTVTVTLPAADLVRAACGRRRSDGAPFVPDARIEGDDDELGRRVVGALPFTI